MHWLFELAATLSPESKRDVQEFQKRIRGADLDSAGRILGVLEAVYEMRHGPKDPQKLEERRMETETMVKGMHHNGVGWSWNGHFVPESPSSDDRWERKKRVVGNGTWNVSRRGWEYRGEFFGIWE